MIYHNFFLSFQIEPTEIKEELNQLKEKATTELHNLRENKAKQLLQFLETTATELHHLGQVVATNRKERQQRLRQIRRCKEGGVFSGEEADLREQFLREQRGIILIQQQHAGDAQVGPRNLDECKHTLEVIKLMHTNQKLVMIRQGKHSMPRRTNSGVLLAKFQRRLAEQAKKKSAIERKLAEMRSYR